MVSILEPGTGEVLEVPASFSEFMGRELLDSRDAALASEFYAAWRAVNGAIPRRTECIGYKVPLFLGGSDTVDNLEVIDLDVYVSICGQLFDGSIEMKPGQRVSGVIPS